MFEKLVVNQWLGLSTYIVQPFPTFLVKVQIFVYHFVFTREVYFSSTETFYN